MKRLGSVLWTLGVLIVAGIYAPVLAGMARVWWTDTYAIHGLFVPFFSALFLWQDRERLRVSAGRGHPAGLLVILLGLGVLALGRWVESPLVQQLSVVISVAGLVLWGWGRGCLRAAAFPVAFLIFMLPPPRWMVEAVTLYLQLFAARSAAMVVELLGIPSYQRGVVIELPTITLEVAEICNGLRFLMALLVLTVAFAQVSQRSLSRKVVLIASAIPIAILANALRIATILVAGYYIGPQAVRGIMHHSIGKAVWVLGLIPVVALGLLLRRGRGGQELQQDQAVVPSKNEEQIVRSSRF